MVDTINKWVLPIGIILCGTVVVPFAHDMVLTSRHLVWCAMVIGLVLCTKQIRLGKIHFLLFGYLVCVICSGIFAINKSEWLYWALRITLVVVYISVVIIDVKLLSKAMILLGIIFVCYFLYECTFALRFIHHQGLMRQRNYWAAAHFFIIPFCYYAVENKIWRNLAIITGVFMVLNIVLLRSRSALLAVIVSAFIAGLTIKKIRWYLMATAVLGIAALIIKGNFISLNYRLEQWKFTARMILDRPLGVGAGNWWIVFPKYTQGITYPDIFEKETPRFPHNDFVWVFAEMGAQGIVYYVGIFIASICYAIKKKQTYLIIGLCGYIAIAFFCALRERVFSSLMVATFIVLACDRKYIFRQPRIILTILIFVAIVFGYRFNSSCWNKKLKVDFRDISYSIKGYSPFSTLTYNGAPWLFYQGVLNFESKNFGMACEQLDTAYNQNPYNIFALNGKGLSCIMKGERNLARQYFQRAIDICPDFEVAKKNLDRIDNGK